jgi:TonB family protein
VNILARRVSVFAARALFLCALVLAVVIAQVALTTGFVALGLPSRWALLASGAVICLIVAAVVITLNRRLRRRLAGLERERERLGLPAGPCCVLAPVGVEAPAAWVLTSPISAHFPPVARALGIEGYAILEFEIGPNGLPRSINCIDVWPAPIFYEAARESLINARFAPAPGVQPRFGASYQAPFVFRIRGAAALRDKGARARARTGRR